MRVAGFGFRTSATSASLHAALTVAGGPLGLDAVSTAQDKADAPAILRLAADLNLPLLVIPVAEIALQATSPGAHAPRRYGGQSLAEAAALAAAGPGAWLRAPRSVSPDGMATAAIAERTTP